MQKRQRLEPGIRQRIAVSLILRVARSGFADGKKQFPVSVFPDQMFRRQTGAKRMVVLDLGPDGNGGDPDLLLFRGNIVVVVNDPVGSGTDEIRNGIQPLLHPHEG